MPSLLPVRRGGKHEPEEPLINEYLALLRFPVEIILCK